MKQPYEIVHITTKNQNPTKKNKILINENEIVIFFGSNLLLVGM